VTGRRRAKRLARGAEYGISSAHHIPSLLLLGAVAVLLGTPSIVPPRESSPRPGVLDAPIGSRFGDSPLSTEIGVVSPTIDSSVAVQAWGNVSGGSPPYGYYWSDGRGNSGSSADWIVISPARGTLNLTLVVWDSGGLASAAQRSLQVVAPPSAQLSPAALNGDAGLPVPIRLTIYGGVPPYSIQWTAPAHGSLARVTASGDFPGYVQFSSPGNFTLSAVVSDAYGVSASSGSASVAIASRLELQVTGSPNEWELGAPVRWNATIQGGTPPYAWFAQATLPCVGPDHLSSVGANRTLESEWNLAAAGNGSLVVEVWDAVGGVAASSENLEVRAALNVSADDAGAPLSVGQLRNLSFGIQGGWGPYLYDLRFSDGQSLNGSLSGAGRILLPWTPERAGAIVGFLSVTDGIDFTVTREFVFLVDPGAGGSSPNPAPPPLAPTDSFLTAGWVAGIVALGAAFAFLLFRKHLAGWRRRTASPVSHSLEVVKGLLTDREEGFDEDSLLLLAEDQGVTGAQVEAALREWKRQGRVDSSEDPTLGRVHRWNAEAPGRGETAPASADDGGSQ
jgi:hypothetical protein